ncbi:MAG: preprotein translocase subunit SecD, partial [Actinomycetota bacterium]|nr:preprotein translocase subunit SecD [Actinomycetota bacterium]
MRRQVWFLTVTVSLVLLAFFATLFGNSRPQLGLDLQGGISVVLFPVKGSDLSTLNTAVQIITNRVDALGVAEPEINRQGNTIVINLPGAKNRQQALALVGRTAELQFRVVTNFVPYTATAGSSTTTAPKGSTTTAKGATTTGAKVSAPTTTAPTSTTAKKGALGAARLRLKPVVATRPLAAAATTTTTKPATTTTKPGATTTTKPGATTTTKPGATTTTTLAPGTTCKSFLTKPSQFKPDLPAVLPYKTSKSNKSDPQQGCYFVGPTLLTGRRVSTAKAQYNGSTGWVVNVTFKGNDFVDKIAGPEVGKEVAIVLDGVVQSAPKINPGITGRNVEISGTFTQGEAKDLALVLKYGSLPVQFDQKQQTVESVSPELGKDQLKAGIAAGLIGLGLVALYMIFFYRLLGLVVWVGLGLTGMIFFALVSYLGRTQNLTLTLAGVTGIIVSVGVTVDSYVVYFERLKDEVRTGKTIRSSLDVGFRRAFRTIVAADLVSLIGATVLYVLAVGSVRGFAYFLGISTAIDLLLAYCFMHPLVWLMSRRPALVRLKGIGIASGLDVARE